MGVLKSSCLPQTREIRALFLGLLITSTAPCWSTQPANRFRCRGFQGVPCLDMQVDNSPRNRPSYPRVSRDAIPHRGQRDPPAANRGRSPRRTNRCTIPTRSRACQRHPTDSLFSGQLFEVCRQRWQCTSSGLRSVADRCPMDRSWLTLPDRHIPIPPRTAGDRSCRHPVLSETASGDDRTPSRHPTSTES